MKQLKELFHRFQAHEAVIKQYLQGKPIQKFLSDVWIDDPEPIFQVSIAYRVKPQEPRIIYVSPDMGAFDMFPHEGYHKFIEIIE